MDSELRPEIASALETERLKRLRSRSRYRVVAATRTHRVLELTETGFVIEADDRPHLRGFVDILEGETRIDRRLVVHSWARDGLVGYEFKREGGGAEVPADHVASLHAGLLTGPGDR